MGNMIVMMMMKMVNMIIKPSVSGMRRKDRWACLLLCTVHCGHDDDEEDGDDHDHDEEDDDHDHEEEEQEDYDDDEKI